VVLTSLVALLAACDPSPGAEAADRLSTRPTAAVQSASTAVAAPQLADLPGEPEQQPGSDLEHASDAGTPSAGSEPLAAQEPVQHRTTLAPAARAQARQSTPTQDRLKCKYQDSRYWEERRLAKDPFGLGSRPGAPPAR
jgi:hypothetical protein